MLKQMSQKAGISQHFTNHSLRAFEAIKLFQAGVSENCFSNVQAISHLKLSISMSTHHQLNYQMSPMPCPISLMILHLEPRSCKPSSSTKEKREEQQPVIVLNACTFIGCAVTQSGPVTLYYKEKAFKEEVNVNKTSKSIVYEDIFDDRNLVIQLLRQFILNDFVC